MGLFKRAQDIIRSNISAVLDKAEDPAKLANQYLRDMSADIRDAESEYANLHAQAEVTRAHIASKQREIENRTTQINAICGDESEEATKITLELIENRRLLTETLNVMESQLLDMEQSIAEITPQLKEANTELESIRQKRDSLIAKSSAAKAETRIAKVVSGIGKEGARYRDGMTRLEEKTTLDRATARAQRNVAGQRTAQDLDNRFKGVMGASSSAQEELERIRAERKNA